MSAVASRWIIAALTLTMAGISTRVRTNMPKLQRGFVVAIAASVVVLTAGVRGQEPETGRGLPAQNWVVS